MIRGEVQGVNTTGEIRILTLETPVQYLKGVGPHRKALFKRLEISTVRDLVYHLPRRYEDRRSFVPIGQLTLGQKQTVRGRVMGSSVFRARTGTVILQVVVKDPTGLLVALWFNQPYMRRWFPVGEELILYGTVDRVGRRLQMAVPEFEIVPSEKRGQATFSQKKGTGTHPEHLGGSQSLHMGRIVPIYPATSGLYQRELRNSVARALQGVLPSLKDPIPQPILQRHKLLDLPTALKVVHFPPTPEAASKAQERLTFEELLFFQIALGMRRQALKKRVGFSHRTTGDLVSRFRQALPFALTPEQEKAIEEITSDMAAPQPMVRLLQGEVGSGKTVVAAYAIVVALQGGFQAAVMAPTEVLARQHALTLTQLLSPLGVSVALATRSLEEPARQRLAEELRRSEVDVLVGTHALLEPWVGFHRLGLVVIDEQQKFGVDQRNALVKKGLNAGKDGKNSDLLILTATPIPRTLALTLYGELKITTISEKPLGRLPVRTLWIDSTRRQEVYAFLKEELEKGHQAFVVAPRIGEDPKGPGLPAACLPARLGQTGRPTTFATRLFEEYQRIFVGYKVGLLHGRMPSERQKAIFRAFRHGELQVLVATQIIEVGVDVPNATVMVIESASAFGLAQLHQLRGRVGRGEGEATCILLADPSHPESMERLKTLVDTSDAFQIAELDLKLRGPGEVLGKRQAGLPDLKCLQWASQGPWLELTRAEAEDLLTQDPQLEDPGVLDLKKEVELRFPSLKIAPG